MTTGTDRTKKGRGMAKTFHVGNREAKLLSKIESSKERERSRTIHAVRENMDMYSNKLSMSLVENGLVETLSKNAIQEQIAKKLDEMCRAEDFDIDFQIAPFRNLVQNPNVVSLYLTAFVLETLINHKDVIDIFGSDEDIYHCIHKETEKLLSPPPPARISVSTPLTGRNACTGRACFLLIFYMKE